MPMRKSSETKLLDAVDEVVFSRGIEATPVDEVLARAGVSAATLYRGYRSKEALVAAALERRQGRWQEEWAAAVDAAHDPAAKLLAVFDAVDDFGRAPLGARWCAFLGAAAEFSDPPIEIADAVARDTDHLRKRLCELAEPLTNDYVELAESILVVLTGELAMRLREPPRTSARGRRIAASLIAGAG